MRVAAALVLIGVAALFDWIVSGCPTGRGYYEADGGYVPPRRLF